MSITVGRGKNTLNRVLKPANTGMSGVASQKLAQVVSQYGAKYSEALKVDGAKLYIWQKMLTGNRCTCSSHSLPKLGGDPHGTIQNLSDTDLPPAVQATLDIGDDATDGSPFNFKSTRVRGSTNQNTTSIPPEYPNEDDIDLSFPTYDNEHLLDVDDEGADEDMQELEISDEELSNAAQQLKLPNTGLFAGVDKTPCAICFRTGWNEGYKLFNGHRIVLDATNPIALRGFALDRKEAPYKFVGPADGGVSYVQWTTDVPRYFVTAMGVRVRNNTHACPFLKVVARPGGTSGSFVDMTTDFLNSLNGQYSRLDVRVVSTLKNIERAIEFTHVEFYYQIAEWPYGQQAPFLRDFNEQYFEILSQSTIEIGPSVTELDRESIIYESRNNQLWYVTGVTPKMTAQKQIFGYEADIRLIQSSETFYLMKLVDDPFIKLNYRGLEKTQGGVDPVTYNRSIPLVVHGNEIRGDFMANNVLNISLQQGSTFTSGWGWTDDAGTAIDITGYTVDLSVVDDAEPPVVQFSFTTGNGLVTITDPTNGAFTIGMNATQTGALTAGTYNYSLVLTSPGSVVTTLATGKFIVVP